MALTLRNNGIGGGIVSAAWWNDYYNLLTGQMSDQYITISQNITLQPYANGTLTAPTLALQAGTNTGIGAYTYGVSWFIGDGQSLVGPTASISTTAGNQKVLLSSLPLATNGTSGRYIWRSKVGTSSPLYLIGTINNNTTTTFLDSTPDASLTVKAPSHSSLGGSLVLKNGGTITAVLYNDGAIWTDAGAFFTDGQGNISGNTISVNTTSYFYGGVNIFGTLSMQPGTQVSLDNGAITSDGAGILTTKASKINPTGVVLNGGVSGTATVYQSMRGTWKYTLIVLSNYRTAAGAQTIALPTPYTFGAWIRAGQIGTSATQAGVSLLNAGAAQTINQYTAFASTGATAAQVTSVYTGAIGECDSPFDTIQFQGGGTAAHSGIVFLEGM